MTPRVPGYQLRKNLAILPRNPSIETPSAARWTEANSPGLDLNQTIFKDTVDLEKEKFELEEANSRQQAYLA